MRSPLADIETSRLVLRLIGAEAITLLLDGKLTEAGVLLGAIIPEELLEKPGSLIYTQTQLNNDSTYLPWSARAIILKNEPNVIGLIRFHSSPDPVELHTWSRNAVELGYRIFSPHRRNKYAAEAVDAMMDWAELHFGINRFIASVAPGNIASNRLISSFGFARIGERVDEIDGIEYVFLKVAGK
jgi:ribosomal-protein-alanine N-acetyltransferase